MMFRYFTVLIALVAQGMALMSPVCFVRCVGADGHECIELVGQGCQRCDCRATKSLPQVCPVAGCCQHETDEDEVRDASEGWHVRSEDCSCKHSPLESAPQVQSKSVNLDGVSDALHVATLPTALDFGSVLRALENERCRPSLFRPQESPHLIVIATVVLRV